MKKKHLFIFGTRPEAIKLAPVIKEFQKDEDIEVRICLTGQHEEMLLQVLDFFQIQEDYNLKVMQSNQSLSALTSKILLGLEEIFKVYVPDFVYVHGDTTTTMAAALSCFYHKIQVGHIEAGLRTHQKYSPFPEECNRTMTADLANYHFAPTDLAKQNLLDEGISEENILVSGNTVIDSIKLGFELVENYSSEELESLKSKIDLQKKLILVTIHRRENHGDNLENILAALKNIAGEKSNDFTILIPVHPNPNVKNKIHTELCDLENIILTPPLSYPSFIWAMKNSDLILSDSGGIQEENTYLQKPLLILRESTERPEVLDCEEVHLVGADDKKITDWVQRYMNKEETQQSHTQKVFPFGEGNAAQIIHRFMKNKV